MLLVLFVVLSANLTIAVNAQVEPVAQPTPTPPSLDRPNLHFYFSNATEQPIGQLLVKIYSYDYNPTLKRPILEQKLMGYTDKQGHIAFDAASVLLLNRLYYMELWQNDTLVLPADPNLKLLKGQPADPPIAMMSVLSLFEGNIIYVFHYQLTSIVSQRTVSQLAINVLANQRFIYYPSANSSLGQLSTITPVPSTTQAQLEPKVTPTPTILFGDGTDTNKDGGGGGIVVKPGLGSSGFVSTATPTVVVVVTPNPNPTVTDSNQPVLPAPSIAQPQGIGNNSPIGSGIRAGATGTAGSLGITNTNTQANITVGIGNSPSMGVLGSTSTSTSTNLITATPLLECRYCISPNDFSSATYSAATYQAQVSQGVYTPSMAEVGRGRPIPILTGTGTSGINNSTAVSTKSAVLPITTTTIDNNIVVAGGENNTPGGSLSLPQQGQGQGQSSRSTSTSTSTSTADGGLVFWLLVVIIIMIVGSVVAWRAGWFNLNR